MKSSNKKSSHGAQNKLNKYAIRKFTVGTGSILIGSLIFLGASMQVEAAENTTLSTETTTSTSTEVNNADSVSNELATIEEVNTTEQPTSELSTEVQSVIESPKEVVFNETNSILTGKATPGVQVILTLADGTQKNADVDASGKFEFTNLNIKSAETVTLVAESNLVQSEAIKVSAHVIEPSVESDKPTSETITAEATTEEVKPSTIPDISSQENFTSETSSTLEQEPTTTPVMVPTTETVNDTVSNVQTMPSLDEKKTILANYYVENTGATLDEAIRTIDALHLDYANLTQDELMQALLNAIATHQDASTPLATPVALRSLTSELESNTLSINEATTMKTLDANGLISNVNVTFTESGTADGIIHPLDSESIGLNVSLTVDDAAAAGDTFTVKYNPDVIVSDLQAQYNGNNTSQIMAFGQVVANGLYDSNTNTITYTFTDFVDKYSNINLNFQLNQFINRPLFPNSTTDPSSVPAEAIAGATVGTQTFNQPYEVVYQQPKVQDTANIQTAFQSYDPQTGELVQIIYVNPLNLNAENTKIDIAGESIFDNNNVMDVKVNESAAVIDNTAQITVYDAGDGTLLPQNMRDESIPYSSYTQVFPNISLGNDIAIVDLGNINSAYVIKVVSHFDVTQYDNGLPIIQSAAMESGPDPAHPSAVFMENTIVNTSLNSNGTGNPTFEIGDQVWEDTNRNGIQDEVNSGIPNAKVTLTDALGNQISTITDAYGKYVFSNLVDGQTYTVSFETPAGYEKPTTANVTTTTADLDSDGSSVTLTINGASNYTVDSGFVTPTPKYSLGDKGFLDVNGNGLQDASEPGFEGIQVDLFQADGVTPVLDQYGTPMTTYTGPLGEYIFTGLENGTYIVQFTLPGGLKGTTSNSGDDTLDSDGVPTANPDVYTATAVINNADNITVDMGITLYKIGDRIWLDSNNNGIQDVTETNFTQPVTVKLTNPDGSPVIRIDGSIVEDIVTTDGTYEFVGLYNGDYVVTFEVPTGTTVTQSDVNANGSDTVDSDGIVGSTPTIATANVTILDGDNNTIDLGVITNTYTLGDRIWLDSNNNGIQDATEANFTQAVTVKLSNSDGTPVVRADGTTVSDIVTTDGTYAFTGLSNGDYVVTFEVPTGTTVTQSDVNANGSDTVDSDGIVGGTPTIATANATIQNADNTTVDLGLVLDTYTLGDRIWLDSNNNGIQDATEANFTQPVTVKLSNPDGTPVVRADGTTVSDIVTTDGTYAFTGLSDGDYVVTFEVPTGTTVTQSDVNANGSDTLDSDGIVGGTPTIATANATIQNADNTTVDLGLVLDTYTLGDRIWLDSNNNGIQDATETNFTQAVTVKLSNPDGTPVVRADGTTVSDIVTTDGTYAFTGLSNGDYVVTFEVPTGTTVTQSDVNANGSDTVDSDGVVGGTPTIATANATIQNADNTTVDLGLLPKTYEIGDFVFEDVNQDGIQDVNDLPIAGAVVTLKDVNGTVIDTFKTGADGLYKFTGLQDGAIYTVEFATPAGYDKATQSNVTTTTDDLDSDGQSVTVTINGANDYTIDSGFIKPVVPPTYSIGDRVWFDANKDNVQTSGEAGISGVLVTLKDATGQVIATTKTDGQGNYLFSGLSNGDYTVEFGQPVNPDGTSSDLIPVTPNVGGDTSLDSNLQIQPVTINNADDLTIDFGFKQPDPIVVPPTYSIGDRVWFDANKDNVQTSGETGISGVLVTLKDATGQVIATTKTDGQGNYLFSGLSNGDYTVEFGQPVNPDGTPSDLIPVTPNVGGDTTLDSNLQVQPVTINNADDLTIDFGFKQPDPIVAPPTYSIGDRVWQDQNNNDVQDAGDTNLEGIKVMLKDVNGNVIDTKYTDINGNYLFTGLKPGNYTVSFSDPMNPDGSPSQLIPVNEHVGSSDIDSDGKDVIITIVDADNLTIDRGYKMPVVIPPVELKYTLGDKVWNDLNKDGIQSQNEPGISGVRVVLIKPDGTTVTTTTDVNGRYEFKNLPKGSYEVTFTTPDGYHPTDGNGTNDVTNSDPKYPMNNVTTGTVYVDLVSDNPNVDAGFIKNDSPVTPENPDTPPVTPTEPEKLFNIGDFVWNDLNHDGIQNNVEPGIEGAVVVLVKPDGSIIKTTTDKNGYYHFSNLPKGTYTIYFETPVGLIQTGVNNGNNDSLDSDGSVITIVLNEDNMSIDSGFYNTDGGTTTPTPGGGTTTPTPGGGTTTPTPGGSTTTPTPGGSTTTPTPGGSTTTPTPGGSTSTPTSGGGTTTPTPGGSTSTPTSGGSTTTPTPETPTPGGSTSTPTSGGSTTTPTPGGEKPSADHNMPIVDEIMPDENATKLPSKAESGPTQATLPDTGEAAENGATAGITLTLGALALLATRRKQTKENN